MNRKRKVSLDDLIFFNRQLAATIKTKMPLPEGLAVIAREIRSETLRQSSAEMEKDLEAGLSLSEAFERQKGTFPELYASMIKAGEESGDLPGILTELREYSDVMWDLEKKIKAALHYPVFMGVFILIYVPLITAFVIPRFATLYESLGGRLPIPTRLTIGFGHFMNSPWGLIPLLGIPLVWFVYRMLRRTEEGRKIFDKLKFVIPWFGTLSKQAEMWRFNRTLGILLKAGVPIVHSLQLVGATSRNKVIELAIADVQQRVSQGEKLSEQCKLTGVFPETMTWMMAMGEERGTLTETLLELANFYDLEVRLSCGKIQSVIGPILLLCLGVIVGFILLSLYLPIFKMGELIGG
jgi:type IV pilus assembly protein PilC